MKEVYIMLDTQQKEPRMCYLHANKKNERVACWFEYPTEKAIQEVTGPFPKWQKKIVKAKIVFQE